MQALHAFLLTNPVAFINGLTPFGAQFIVFCAIWLPILTGVWVTVYLLFRPIPNHSVFAPLENLSRRFFTLVVVFVSALGAYVASIALKNYFEIGRPAVLNLDLHPLIKLTDYGFPSSHATFFAALSTALFFIHRRAGVFAGLLAIVIGAARIFAGVHTPLDIIGGFILGALCAVLVDFVAESVDSK